MTQLSEILHDSRAAVEGLITAAEHSGSAWTVPRGPGKWSPSQLVEHVARGLEESANEVAGLPSRFPRLPGLLRPLLRGLFFNRVVKRGAFPKARTNRALDPATGPATPADARPRLEPALARFDRECRARAGRGQPVETSAFGTVSVEDYARFQTLHVRHHLKQMPGVKSVPAPSGPSRGPSEPA